MPTKVLNRLELPSNQDRTMMLSHHATYRYIKSSPDRSQEFRQECGTTQLESGDGQLFDRRDSGLGCHKGTCRAVIIICCP